MKKKQHGGSRPGAGRKETGRNTISVSFSMHKDYKKIIKQLVYAKLKELKNGGGSGVKIGKQKPKPVVNSSVTVGSDKIVVAPKSGSMDYMKKRMNFKLGIK